jgi:hypothetical protein
VNVRSGRHKRQPRLVIVRRRPLSLSAEFHTWGRPDQGTLGTSNLQPGPLLWAALFISGIAQAQFEILSQKPPERPLPQPMVCMHEVLCLGQHGPAMPLKSHDPRAVQRCRGQEGRARERIVQFPSQARDRPELNLFTAEPFKRRESVSGINLDDDLRQRAAMVVAADLDS